MSHAHQKILRQFRRQKSRNSAHHKRYVITRPFINIILRPQRYRVFTVKYFYFEPFNTNFAERFKM
uniref:Uncharacterized protein n=1 Tax=Glossina palpalis gambiensis TaxID=67801 RepID=A0A1B0AU72_9MUSC